MRKSETRGVAARYFRFELERRQSEQHHVGYCVTRFVYAHVGDHVVYISLTDFINAPHEGYPHLLIPNFGQYGLRSVVVVDG